MFKAVNEFNEKVIGISRDVGLIEDGVELDFITSAIDEEVGEFISAHNSGDLIGCIDATVDIMYFACGLFTRMGIPPEVAKDMFFAVHEANMQKNAGPKNGRAVQHGTDASKPDEWIGPEERISEILSKYTQGTV